MYGKLTTFKAQTIALFRRLRKTSGELAALVGDTHWYEREGAVEAFKEQSRQIVDMIAAGDAAAEDDRTNTEGGEGRAAARSGGGADECLLSITVAKPRRMRADLQRDFRIYADRIELRVPGSSKVAESFPASSVFGAFVSASSAQRIVLALRSKDSVAEMVLVAGSGAAAKKARQLLTALASSS